MDKCYTDVNSELWAVIFTKELPNGWLLVADRNRSQNIAGDRVIIENVSGGYAPLVRLVQISVGGNKNSIYFLIL